MLKTFAAYYKPHQKLFWIDMLCAFVAAAIDLAYPVISRDILNIYIPQKNLRLVLIWCAVLLALYVFQIAMNYIMQYWGHMVGVRMQADMRRDVFSHLHRLPFSYFDEHKTGVIMSRIINDLMDISEFAHHGPEDLFISAVSVIGAFVILLSVNVPLTLVIFAVLPFLFAFVLHKRMDLRRTGILAKAKIAEVNASLENSIAGVRVARAFSGQEQEAEKFEADNLRFVEARRQSYKVMAEFFSGTNFITALLNVLVLSLGGVFLFYEQITFGDLVAYMLFINMFLKPINKLIQFVEMFQNAITGYERFQELMQVPEETEDPSARRMGPVQGDIRFTDVTFHYNDDTEVLSHLSLRFAPGEMTAIVGPSGGGKTTLCHLIPRFYEIQSGSITIDGQDIRSVTRASLRQQIGIVQQEVFLFTGTIYENILYGRPDATRQEVEEAARRANIHDYIMGLEHGYDTYVGERGVMLSGGQKQRISIARVFLKNPPILILDEATSALDTLTENMIQDAIDQLCQGRTTIVVAHRLSTIRNANRILVLGRDGIQEEGTHQQLLQNPNGVYHALYQAQFARL